MIDRKKYNGKLLHCDIETCHHIAATHYIGSKVSMNHEQILVNSRILTIAYKVEGWKKAKLLTCDVNMDDRRILKEFNEVAIQYPYMIGQNFKAFDLKVLKGRCWINDINPLQNVEVIDTLQMSRGNMRLASHTLDYKAKVIGGHGKNKMYMGDWLRATRIAQINIFYEKHLRLPTKTELKIIDDGVSKALNKMGRYNIVDVDECQKVFWSLLPHCDKLSLKLGRLIHPEGLICLKCSSKSLVKNGPRAGNNGTRQRFVCKDCGNDWTDTRLKRTTDKLWEKRNG